nr:hypothetical protein [Tanacetum cinerariifolium]
NDYNSAITPVLSTEEPDNSLSMGDEHLDTILATKSDEIIKSTVKDLVPIQSESEGIPNTMCDVHFVNNPTPLKAKDHFEIVINSKDDISSSDDDSLYNENIDTTTHSDISLPDYEVFYFNDGHIEEISSGSTTTHSGISLFEYDSFVFILRMISFRLPIGVTLLMRSSSMNSLTSYLHRSMTVSALGIYPIRVS